MILNELFKKSKKIVEGGNLELPNPQEPTQPHQAQDIELKIHNRSYMVGILDKLMNDINNTFASRYKKTLWSPELLKNRTFLSGSSLHFFDVKNIPDEVFVAKKPKVGDIDTQCDVTQEPQVGEFLKSIQGQKIGNSTFIGFKPGNNQFSSLWALDEPPVKIQIDFEFGRYDPETNAPDEWYAYSHSSAWEDVEAGIKGVFHKYVNRALTGVSATEKYVARVLKKGVKISPEPVTDNDLSFAVSGGQGGGMSRKYKPYIDPTTGEPQVINGIPVMQLIEPKDRDYLQNLNQQFELIYGRKPSDQDRKLMNSFVGTVQLANKYLDDQARESVATSFIDICFEPGSQMINKDDPARDREVKFAAIDFMLENMKLPNAATIRKNAIAMSKAYEDAYRAKKGTTPLAEAEVKAQLRKGMPHLRDLKPADLLDLIDEIHDGNGRFKLENIPLNVKVDGFGGRFGKNADGKPFMGTSRTEPRYEPGFVAYHQKKGTTDPEVLGRAQLFDDLFEEMMNAVKLVDSKLGPDFLVNKQVTCEVLYLPFATETEEGKLKFVGIHYDKLPEGVQLALVPFRVTDATTGEDLPDSNQIVKELTTAGQMGSVMFINNSLTQNEALDVTALVPPVENIEQLKAMLASNKLEAKRQVKAALEPVALALETAIINDPNIIGKDMLGKDYEGIVINSRLGPIKVTSQEQRDVISAKNAAKANARTERPRENTNKTAVVAIGSFVGHRGHQDLFQYTIDKAKEVGGDPYLFIGNAEGKDDPIPPAVKVETWHKLYPQYAKNISTVQAGGQLIQKVKHELINPLPGKPPRYDNIIIMVGEDRAGMNMPTALMKAVNKFPGYEHVKVALEVTPRESGFSGTLLRNSLKNDSPEQALATWSKAFDVQKLGVDWIKHLMDITRKGMGIQQPQAPVPQAAPVAETRLLNALIRSSRVMEDSSNAIGSMAKNLTGPGAPAAKLRAARDQERMKQGERSYGQPQSPKWNGVKEDEGDAEGLKHISKKLLQHIVQQVGTEGAHAIVKSLQYGDGAAKELLQLLTKDLKQNIAGMKQEDHSTATGGWGQGSYDTYVSGSHGHGVAEGLGKDIKRLATGKDVKSRAGQEIAKSQDASMKGDTKTSKKHFDRYDKLDKLANKDVAEGSEYKSRHAHKQEQDKAYNDYRTKHATSSLALMTRAEFAKDQRERAAKKKQGVAEGSGKNVVKSVKVGNFRHDLVNTGMGWQVRIYNGDELYDTGLSKNSEEKGLAALDNSVAYTKKQLNIKEQGVAEGLEDTVSFREMVDVVDKHYPKYYAELSGSNISDKQFEQKITSAYKKIMQKQGVAEGVICPHCEADPCICDDSHGFVNEERMSAAVRMQRAADRQRAKSDASLRRTPSSIPKPEPKKDEKTNEEGGVGVIASKKQAKDPRYSTSLTVDVRPGQVEKNLKAFNLAEKMMPASMFAGSKKNKLGPAGQWKNTGPKKNKPAKAGDLVGGMEESLRNKTNCVPVSENIENIMDSLINKIVVNEAIQNNKR